MWNIPDLNPDLLAITIPLCTYGGGAITDPTTTLFLWRSVATNKARDATICFFLNDERLERLWRVPSQYAHEFAACGIAAAVEPDFSIWSDRPQIEGIFNTYRKRVISRIFQGCGIKIIPNLNWSNEDSYDFCFSGIPENAPLAFTECRTASSSTEDRRAFLSGLHAGVTRLRPKTLVIYGGSIHRWWIERDLPTGSTKFLYLEAWTDARRKFRAAQARREQERHQPNLFTGGDSWAEEAQAVA